MRASDDSVYLSESRHGQPIAMLRRRDVALWHGSQMRWVLELNLDGPDDTIVIHIEEASSEAVEQVRKYLLETE